MKKIENGELKDFFKQILQIPSENLKEFIFDKKKYVKYEDDISDSLLCWFINEWCGDSWKTTDKVIITHVKLMKYTNDWIFEGDMSEEQPVDIAPVNKSGTFLKDL